MGLRYGFMIRASETVFSLLYFETISSFEKKVRVNFLSLKKRHKSGQQVLASRSPNEYTRRSAV